MTKITLDAVRTSSPFLGASIGVHAGLLALLFLSFGVAGGENSNPPSRIEYDIGDGVDWCEPEMAAEAPESEDALEAFEPTDVPLESPIEAPEFDIPPSETNRDTRTVLWQRDVRPIRRKSEPNSRETESMVVASAAKEEPQRLVAADAPKPTAAPSSNDVPVPLPVVFRPARKDAERCPAPRYPERARKNRWIGVVIVEVATDEQGEPIDVAIITSSGHDVLDDAALEAVRRWRFHPATSDGIATASRFRVPIRFGPAR